MYSPFEFATAGRIIFGAGKFALLPELIAGLGKRAFFVTGMHPERYGTVAGDVFRVDGEPTTATVRDGAEAFRASSCDLVVAIGGGSAVDAGKAIAAASTNPRDLFDYLEVIGKGLPLEHAPAPFIAVPTTAGTGSEVTRNAVLGSPQHGVKVSLRHASMLPRIALVDPELTRGLPASLTAATGLDALTQLIEPYVCVRANALTDLLCVEGIPLAAGALPVLCARPRDAEARTKMAWASLLGGMALANAGLGVVHGFAAPIGGKFPAPHGAVCAALLTHGMRGNIQALRARDPNGEALGRYAAVGRLLTGVPGATAEDGVAFIADLVEGLGIPSLATYGIQSGDLNDLAAAAERSGSMKANPIVLTRSELIQVAEAAL